MCIYYIIILLSISIIIILLSISIIIILLSISIIIILFQYNVIEKFMSSGPDPKKNLQQYCNKY